MNVDNLKFLTHQHTVVHSVISCLISVERQINLSVVSFIVQKAFIMKQFFRFVILSLICSVVCLTISKPFLFLFRFLPFLLFVNFISFEKCILLFVILFSPSFITGKQK